MKKILALLCALLMVVSMTACANKTEDDGKYKIGVCQIQPHPALDAATEGFKQALIDAFGAENVEFDVQNAAGDSNTCSTIVNSFVSDRVDLILANATPSLQAAAAATSVIPILGTSVTEYGVALEIDNFSGTVGGNISGTSDLADLAAQAKMLKDWFPDAKKVGLLYCVSEANSIYQVNTVQAELEKMGYTCKQYSFSDGNDLAAVTQQAVGESDVLYVPTDNTAASYTGIIDGICRPAKKPVIAGEEGICAGCGVATMSISYYDLGYDTGKMAVKILTGEADIATMPVGYAENVTYKYNEEICTELGLTPPEGYVAIGK